MRVPDVHQTSPNQSQGYCAEGTLKESTNEYGSYILGYGDRDTEDCE
jgi:hypothetical protein